MDQTLLWFDTYQRPMTRSEVIHDTVRRLTLEEVGYCRLYVTLTLRDDEAAAWLRRLDAWEAFLRLDAAAPPTH